MTTDTFPKGATATVDLDGVPVKIAGFAKGSGMIAPDMATMLVYIFTDVKISQAVLQQILWLENANTFNCITVDGDTSTSDTLLLAEAFWMLEGYFVRKRFAMLNNHDKIPPFEHCRRHRRPDRDRADRGLVLSILGGCLADLPEPLHNLEILFLGRGPGPLEKSNEQMLEATGGLRRPVKPKAACGADQAVGGSVKRTRGILAPAATMQSLPFLDHGLKSSRHLFSKVSAQSLQLLFELFL